MQVLLPFNLDEEKQKKQKQKQKDSFEEFF